LAKKSTLPGGGKTNTASCFIEAYRLCNDVDENHTTCVALTLELSGLLWTRDEELKSGLRRRGFDRFSDESLLKA